MIRRKVVVFVMSLLSRELLEETVEVEVLHLCEGTTYKNDVANSAEPARKPD